VLYISPSLDIDITILNKMASVVNVVNVGTWKTNKGFEKAPNYNQTKIKPFYRVGKITVVAVTRSITNSTQTNHTNLT
jgi:hypothetical protein